MAKWIEVGPSYGRDYKNQKDAQSDWAADKDFTLYEGAGLGGYGQKTNRADIKGIEKSTGEKINVIIRYDRQMKTMTAK